MGKPTKAQRVFLDAMRDLTSPGTSDKQKALYAGDCADAAMARAEEVNAALLARIEALEQRGAPSQSISDEDKANILALNAKRLFKIS